jgi:transcriptional regulator with XRE-family HTH domain
MDVGRKDTKSAFNERIIEELIRRRKDAGITQWDVARRMKTDQSQISKFERRERRLDIVDYVRYCRAIGLDPGELLRE